MTGRLHRRLKALEGLLGWLNEYDSRLTYTLPPLRDFLRDSVDDPAYRDLGFLRNTASLLQERDFGEAWAASVERYAGEDGFDTTDRKHLLALGSRLGVSDAGSQRKILREEIARLSERREELLQKRRKADRLYTLLGGSGGLAVAVLMM